MARRYWVVSQFYAEDTGTGYSMTRIAEGLAQFLPVDVLCGQPHYLSRDSRAPSFEERNGVRIRRVPATPFSNDRLMLKAVNMLSISIMLFLYGLRYIRPHDVVFFTNLPPVAPFFVSLACHLRRASCVLRIDDVYPDIVVIVGGIRAGGLLHRFLDGLYRRLYKSVDAIVVLGRDTRRLLLPRVVGAPVDVYIIPNAGAVQSIYPVERAENALLKELDLVDKFVVKYGGHMGRTHGLEVIMDAAEKLSDVDDIHFLLIGSGPRKGWLEKTVRERRLRNVTIIPYRPRAELCDAINACDVGIISLAAGMAGVSVPGRIYDLLAAGKPAIVVADHASELSLLVREEGIGWVVPPGDSDKLVETVLLARSQMDLFPQIVRRARQACEQKYSLQREIDAYRALLLRVSNGRD